MVTATRSRWTEKEDESPTSKHARIRKSGAEVILRGGRLCKKADVLWARDAPHWVPLGCTTGYTRGRSLVKATGSRRAVGVRENPADPRPGLRRTPAGVNTLQAGRGRSTGRIPRRPRSLRLPLFMPCESSGVRHSGRPTGWETLQEGQQALGKGSVKLDSSGLYQRLYQGPDYPC